MHVTFVHAQFNERLGDGPYHRVGSANERLGGLQPLAEVLVEFAHLVGIESARRDGKFLVLPAEYEMQLQALGIPALETIQVVDEHRRRLLAVAVEEYEAAVRFCFQNRPDHRE